MDSTFKSINYASEVQFHELTSGTINTKPDTAGLKGFIYVFDTTGYDEDVETVGLRLHTSVHPHIVDGKIVGYNVKSNAISKEQNLSIPTTRDIIIKGNFNQEETKAIVKKNESSSTSSFISPNVIVWSIVGFDILLIVFLLIKGNRK